MTQSDLIPVEKIVNAIHFIRGEKVMLDRDLAALYGVETKMLKRAVRRNIDRFPADFMFVLSSTELKNWRRQFGTSKGRSQRASLSAYGVHRARNLDVIERAEQ